MKISSYNDNRVNYLPYWWVFVVQDTIQARTLRQEALSEEGIDSHSRKLGQGLLWECTVSLNVMHCLLFKHRTGKKSSRNGLAVSVLKCTRYLRTKESRYINGDSFQTSWWKLSPGTVFPAILHLHTPRFIHSLLLLLSRNFFILSTPSSS